MALIECGKKRRAVRSLRRALGGALRIGIGATAGALLLSALLYRTPTGAALAASGMALVAPWPRARGRWVPRMAGAAVVLALMFFLTPRAFREIGEHNDRLTAQLERSGAGSLSFGQRASVYVLGLWMGIVGYPFFPEAAREHLFLYVGGPKRRVWRSDFAMRSELIAGNTRSLIWSHYDLPYWERRVALATNGGTLESRPDGRGRVELVVTVPVRYPRRCRAVLFRFRGEALAVEEGLFWALQEVGWLHPYTAEWCFGLLDRFAPLDPR